MKTIKRLIEISQKFNDQTYVKSIIMAVIIDLTMRKNGIEAIKEDIDYKIYVTTEDGLYDPNESLRDILSISIKDSKKEITAYLMHFEKSIGFSIFRSAQIIKTDDKKFRPWEKRKIEEVNQNRIEVIDLLEKMKNQSPFVHKDLTSFTESICSGILIPDFLKKIKPELRI